jgi:hypothetical protein
MIYDIFMLTISLISYRINLRYFGMILVSLLVFAILFGLLSYVYELGSILLT